VKAAMMSLQKSDENSTSSSDWHGVILNGGINSYIELTFEWGFYKN
jgi:hypothetical protein